MRRNEAAEKRPLPGGKDRGAAQRKRKSTDACKMEPPGGEGGDTRNSAPAEPAPLPFITTAAQRKPRTVFLWVRVPVEASSPRGLGALLRHTHLRRRTVITRYRRYETVRVLPGTQRGNRITAFFRSSITHHLQMCDMPRYPGGSILQASNRKSKEGGRNSTEKTRRGTRQAEKRKQDTCTMELPRGCGMHCTVRLRCSHPCTLRLLGGALE